MSSPAVSDERAASCCEACRSGRIEYEFLIGRTQVWRCRDCTLLFASDLPARDAAISTPPLADRVTDRVAHARAHGAFAGRLLVVVPEACGATIEHADIVCCDALESAFGPYDAAVCVDVLDRVDDVAAWLGKLARLLPEGAAVSVTVASVDSITARYGGSSWPGFRSGARRFFGVDTLQNALAAAGFRNPRVYSASSLHPHSLRLRLAGAGMRAAGLRRAAARSRARGTLVDTAMTFICRRELPVVRHRLSVIVPVFNERDTFSELMTRLVEKQLPDADIEIIIVESNSTDGSREEVLRFADHPRVTILLQDRPNGKGNAVRAGLARATGDVVLFQDADLEYEIEDYDDLVRPIFAYQRNFVIGARHGTAAGAAWKMREFNGAPVLSQVFNLGHVVFLGLLNGVYAQSMSDPFSMFKVFRSDCLAGLEFECDRFDFDFEIVIKLLRKGYRPLELAVNYHARSIVEGKKVTMIRDPLTWLRALARFRTNELYPGDARTTTA